MKPAGRGIDGRTLLLQGKNTGKTTIKSPHPPFTKGGQGGIFVGEEGFSEQNQKAWRSLWAVICLLCSILILIGCATSEDVGKLQYDLIQLRSDVRNIKTQIPGQKGELNERLQNLEEQQKATSKAVSDLLIKVQSLTTELRILTGRFDEAQYFSEKSLKELTESKDTLIAQIKGLEVAVNELKEKLARLESAEIPLKKQKPDEKAEKAEEQKSEKPEEGEKTPKREVKDIYMDAYKIFKENKFTDAREKFEALLKDYPENEYSDNARLWIGESYYKEKNYAEAILAYDELLKKNPESNKVPGAYLKQGLAFYELKEEELGKITLEILIEKFPDSEQAKIAKKKLSPLIPVKKN